MSPVMCPSSSYFHDQSDTWINSNPLHFAEWRPSRDLFEYKREVRTGANCWTAAARVYIRTQTRLAKSRQQTQLWMYPSGTAAGWKHFYYKKACPYLLRCSYPSFQCFQSRPWRRHPDTHRPVSSAGICSWKVHCRYMHRRIQHHKPCCSGRIAINPWTHTDTVDACTYLRRNTLHS